MALKTYLSQIRQLIAKDELPSALQQLHALLEDSPKLNEVIHQTGRFTDIQKHMRLGTLSFEQGTVNRNQISLALLDLLDEITQQGQHQTIKAEIEKHHVAIQHSKNVLNDSTINARDVHIGDTHVHYGDKKIPRHLGSLVSKPGLLLGREDDLYNIHQQLQSGQHFLLLVNGMGGMGKTTLAAEYYCRYLPQYTHLAWVFAETGITEALLTLNNKLKVDFPPAMPNSERVMLLMDTLRELEGPALLVIDNANDLDELKKHDKILRACPNFRLLLTSRITEFAQASTYPIAPLEKEKAALEVFKTHYEAFEAQEIPLFYEIYDSVQGNTLVLEVLAKNLQQHNTKLKKRYQLAELKRDLEKGLSHLSQSKEVAVEYQAKGTGLRHEKPAVILLAMYDLSELSREESQLLSNFAVLPAEYLPYVLLESLLPDLLELDQLLIALAQKGWLDKNVEGDAFRVNPVVQEVVRVKNEGLLEDCRGLIDGLAEKLAFQPGLGHLLNSSYEEAAVFAKLGESIIHVALPIDTGIADLCRCLGKFHQTTGDLNQARYLFEKYHALVTKLVESDPQAQAYKIDQVLAFDHLGDTFVLLGDLQKGLIYFEQDSQIAKELSMNFPQEATYKSNLAISYSKLGRTHRDLGNLQQALTFFEAQAKLFEELFADYPQNVVFKDELATSACWIGITQSDLGNLQQALTFFEQYNELEKELYAAYPQNMEFKNNLAISYQFLGITHSDLGNLQQALTFFEYHTKLCEEMYAAYPQNVYFKNGLAVSYFKLGEFNRDKKEDPQKAMEYFQQCYMLLKELAETYPDYVEFRENLAEVKEVLGKE